MAFLALLLEDGSHVLGEREGSGALGQGRARGRSDRGRQQQDSLTSGDGQPTHGLDSLRKDRRISKHSMIRADGRWIPKFCKPPLRRVLSGILSRTTTGALFARGASRCCE